MARRASSVLRSLDNSECQYVLFIDGIDVAFTTDNSGELLGSASDNSTWIYASQTELASTFAFEAPGTHPRTVKPGLIFNQVRLGEVDLADGQFKQSSTSFEIIDLDNSLSAIFGQANKSYSILDASGMPGVSTTFGTSYSTLGAAGNYNPRGKHINLEYVGTSGERRVYRPMPITMLGLSHQFITPDDAPQLQVIGSDEPILFDGRMVALYRIYKDPHGTGTAVSQWETWSEAHTAGNLVWWGTMRGPATTSSSRRWKFSCYGPDGLLAKKLGVSLDSTAEYRLGESPLELAEQDRYLLFQPYALGGNNPINGTSFRDGETELSSSYATRQELLDDLNSFVDDVLAGTNATTLYVSSPAVPADYSFSISFTSAGLRVVQANKDFDDPDGYIVCRLTLSMTVLNWLGYDYVQQPRATDRYYANIEYNPDGGDTLGWWTIDPTNDPIEKAGFVNAESYYYARFPGGVTVMPASAGVNFSSLDTINPPTQYSIPATSAAAAALGANTGHDPGGMDTCYAMMTLNTINVDGTEGEEVSFPCVISYPAGGSNAVFIERFEHPQTFGLENQLFTGTLLTQPNSIRLRPFFSYNALVGAIPTVYSTWCQAMLSTGTGGGYDDWLPATTSLGVGANDYNTVTAVHNDCEIADLGLGIPVALMQSPSATYNAFNSVPGGVGGPLSRARYSFAESINSEDLFRWIMVPRRLMWTLHGNKYGVQPINEFDSTDVQVVLTENDICGTPGNPSSAADIQSNFFVHGSIDSVSMETNYVVGLDNPGQKTISVKAKTLRARLRSKNRVLEIEDPGAVNSFWRGYSNAYGLSSWEQPWRKWWAADVADYMATPQVAVTAPISLPKGQDIKPGTIVSFTNPWVMNLDGTYGVTAAVGLVTRVDFKARDNCYEVDITFTSSGGVGDNRFWMPIASVRGVDGSTIYLNSYLDWTGSALSGLSGYFTEPAFSSVGTQGYVKIIDDVGDSSSSYQVASVDTVNNTVTVSGGPITGLIQARNKWLVFAPYADQNGSWVESYGAVVCQPDGIFDTTEEVPPLR